MYMKTGKVKFKKKYLKRCRLRPQFTSTYLYYLLTPKSGHIFGQLSFKFRKNEDKAICDSIELMR